MRCSAKVRGVSRSYEVACEARTMMCSAFIDNYETWLDLFVFKFLPYDWTSSCVSSIHPYPWRLDDLPLYIVETCLTLYIGFLIRVR